MAGPISPLREPSPLPSQHSMMARFNGQWRSQNAEKVTHVNWRLL